MNAVLKSRAAGALVAASLVLSGGLMGSSAHAAETSIDVTKPVDASTLPGTSAVIEGTVGAKGSTGVDSVTYVIDLSGSTDYPNQMDCNGDGVANDKDDFNGDSSVGDVLDCEIASVISLNKSLQQAYGNGIKVSMVAFGSSAEVVDLNGATFVTPGAMDAQGRNVVEHAARNLVSGTAKEYTEKYVGRGTNFDSALQTTLGSLPASGDRWVFMMSDGQSSVSASTLQQLKASGHNARTFGVGDGSSCVGPLTDIASSTGQSCVEVKDPTKLAAALSGKPVNVKSVSVTVTGPDGYSKTIDVTSSITALGDWKTTELTGLKPGEYTAVATATFTDGASKTDKTTFKVGDQPTTPPSSSAPPTSPAPSSPAPSSPAPSSSAPSSSAPSSSAPSSSAPTSSKPTKPGLPNTGN